MHIDTLVTMVNDIGAFFTAEADQTEAARNISTHLRRYWDPRMRAQIVAHYRAGGEGLCEAAYIAIGLLDQNSDIAGTKQAMP